jgi:tetratricopeptide (TPR) repeat protein
MSNEHLLRQWSASGAPATPARVVKAGPPAARAFSELEADFFAREAELYETARGADDDLYVDEPRPHRSTEGSSRGVRRLGVAVAVAAGAALMIVRLGPSLAGAASVSAPRSATTAPKAEPSAPIAPAPQAAPLEASSAGSVPASSVARPPVEVAARASAPEADATPPSGAVEAPPEPAPRKLSRRSTAAFTGALSRCRAAISADRVRRALDACRAALTLRPRSTEALTLLAHAEIDRDHTREALRLAAAAVSIDPRAPDAYLILGQARQQSGLKSEARASYQRYLALAPHGRYAGDVRSILQRGL